MELKNADEITMKNKFNPNKEYIVVDITDNTFSPKIEKYTENEESKDTAATIYKKYLTFLKNIEAWQKNTMYIINKSPNAKKIFEKEKNNILSKFN